MLVIRGELDYVRDEPDNEEYVVGCLERGVRLFDSLVYREHDREQNQILCDRFRGQGGC